MRIFGREPALWVGTIISLILAAVSVLLGDGIITDAFAGQITDGAEAFGQIAYLLLPMLTALIARHGTTSYAEPKLPIGTPVLVERPAGLPADTPPPDAVVALRTDLKPEAR